MRAPERACMCECVRLCTCICVNARGFFFGGGDV